MSFNCRYCNGKLKTRQSLGQHSRKCIPYQKILSSITKEKLIDLYVNQNMSCIDIQEYFGLHTYSQIYKKMKEYGIPRRNLSDACSMADAKRRKTNLKRYGSDHNFNKDHQSRKKWEKRLQDEEGITNVFQREDVKQKSRDTFLRRYGFESPAELQMSRGKNTYSSVHREVVEFLGENGVDVVIEYKVPKDKCGYYSYDIQLVDTNKIIEVYGDYWHGNPEIYNDNDLILKGSSREMKVKDKHRCDKKKNDFAIKLGYSVLVVWENDLKNNRNETNELILNYSTSTTSPGFSSSVLR